MKLSFKALQRIPSGPSYPRMALNFAQAAAQSAKQVATGHSPHVPNHLFESRLAICRTNACGFYVVQAEQERCSHIKCGCYLNSLLLQKPRMTGQTCPVGSW